MISGLRDLKDTAQQGKSKNRNWREPSTILVTEEGAENEFCCINNNKYLQKYKSYCNYILT